MTVTLPMSTSTDDWALEWERELLTDSVSVSRRAAWPGAASLTSGGQPLTSESCLGGARGGSLQAGGGGGVAVTVSSDITSGGGGSR